MVQRGGVLMKRGNKVIQRRGMSIISHKPACGLTPAQAEQQPSTNGFAADKDNHETSDHTSLAFNRS